MNKNEMLEAIVKATPYPGQIREWDLDGEPGAVRFTWRGIRFMVSDDLFVETVEDGLLSGGEMSILLQALLRRAAAE